jgi:hypothetical protein
MAKLSSIIICDGAVSSFGHWTLVGATRTLWGNALPFEASFGVYLCLTDVRDLSLILLELIDPVAAAAGETGAIKWRREFSLEGNPLRPTEHHFLPVDAVTFLRAIDHELHVFVAGKLVDVVTIEVVA